MEWRFGILSGRQFETAEELRDRLIAETSAFLTESLRHPELCVRIPIIQVGAGRFPPSMCNAFWANALAE